MRYFLFLDESGDHGLNIVDPAFPIFILCGIIMPESAYTIMTDRVEGIKNNFWGNKKVIFHSRDIRKCEKEFKILLDKEIKSAFYKQLDMLMTEEPYSIICSCVHKKDFITKYGRTSDDIYNISLSNIIERMVFYLDDIDDTNKQVYIGIEKRGDREDKLLTEHLQKIISRGTYYVSSARIKALLRGFSFHSKPEDLAGLQIADLAAYPIARHVMDPNRANPAFDLIEPKFYRKNNKRYGLKTIP